MNKKPAPEVLEKLTSCCCKKSECPKKARLQNSCVQTFACENNGSGEDDDELSDEYVDEEITDNDDGESELVDGRELFWCGCTKISILCLINWSVR